MFIIGLLILLCKDNVQLSIQSDTGGVYCQFYPGKTDFSLYLCLVSVCLYICTGFSVYIPIS